MRSKVEKLELRKVLEKPDVYKKIMDNMLENLEEVMMYIYDYDDKSDIKYTELKDEDKKAIFYIERLYTDTIEYMHKRLQEFKKEVSNR